MKSALVVLVLASILLICNSCNLTNPNDSHYELMGTIKDSAGNVINDASVYIGFDWVTQAESEFQDPAAEADQPRVPPIWSFPCAYPNPTDSCTVLPFYVEVDSRISLKISSSYLGEVRTLCDESLVHANYGKRWDGRDNNGNLVCNGIYRAELVARSETNSILFQKTVVILINDVGFNNRPAALSTSSGYRIHLGRYFQFGSDIIQTDVNGNELGVNEIDGEFNICIKKEGYQTIVRHVSLNTYFDDHREDFILQPLSKSSK